LNILSRRIIVKNWKKFLVDSIGNAIFFVPMMALLNFTVLQLEPWQLLVSAGFSLFAAFVLGGVYGKFLDLWRRWLKV